MAVGQRQHGSSAGDRTRTRRVARTFSGACRRSVAPRWLRVARPNYYPHTGARVGHHGGSTCWRRWSPVPTSRGTLVTVVVPPVPFCPHRALLATYPSLPSTHLDHSRRAETGDTFKTRGVNMKPISNGNPPGTSGPVLSTSLFLACGRRGRPCCSSRQSRQVKDPKQAARAARHVLPLYYRCHACMSMLISV